MSVFHLTLSCAVDRLRGHGSAHPHDAFGLRAFEPREMEPAANSLDIPVEDAASHLDRPADRLGNKGRVSAALAGRLTRSNLAYGLALTLSVSIALLTCAGIYRLATDDTPVSILIASTHRLARHAETSAVLYDPARYTGLRGSADDNP